MKYQIWEMLLTEYVGAPDAVLIDEIEAKDHHEAYKAACVRHPQKHMFRVTDGKVAVEYSQLL